MYFFKNNCTAHNAVTFVNVTFAPILHTYKTQNHK